MQPAVILDELIETIPDLSSFRNPLWRAYELMARCCEGAALSFAAATA